MNPHRGSLPDHYAILGISEEATFDEIRTAYRQVIFKHHPDRNPGDIQAHTQTIAINIAYEILSEETARSNYDAVRRYHAPKTSESWNVAQERAYDQARSTYQESEHAARERVKKWFYERLGVRSTKNHRCYIPEDNGVALDNLLLKIGSRLGNKLWEYRITAAPASSDRMKYQIRIVCDPSKCGFREHHADWVEGYYYGLFKAGAAEDAAHNVRLANTWLGDILAGPTCSHEISVFFGIVGSLPAPWRCYLDLSVVMVISAFDAFFHASVPGLSKFARENSMEVAIIFTELAKERRMAPADLCFNHMMRKQLARHAENILRVRYGIKPLREF